MNTPPLDSTELRQNMIRLARLLLPSSNQEASDLSKTVLGLDISMLSGLPLPQIWQKMRAQDRQPIKLLPAVTDNPILAGVKNKAAQDLRTHAQEAHGVTSGTIKDIYWLHVWAHLHGDFTDSEPHFHERT